MAEFKGKTAPWYAALTVGGLALIAALYVSLVPSASNEQGGQIAALVLMGFVLYGAMMLPSIFRNRVEVYPPSDEGPGHVDIVYGLVRTKIQLADIASVECSRSLFLVADRIAANSRDAVRIVTDTGGACLVSLQDNDGFVRCVESLLGQRRIEAAGQRGHDGAHGESVVQD
ncbi:MAG: PH domain-containing protein [Coriobacteriaceae bacterium]|nr:PH domain-containing protein [Coriobacteriaceae bacterium]